MGLLDSARQLGADGRRRIEARGLQMRLDRAARELGFLVYRGRQGVVVEPERQQALFAEMVTLEAQLEQVRRLSS